MGDGVAGRSPELHPAVGRARRRTGTSTRRRRTSGTSRCRRGCRSTRRSPCPTSATRLRNQVSLYPYNEVPPGVYPNLQAAKPYPAVRRDQRAGESRHRRVQRPADQAGSGASRTGCRSPDPTRWPRTRRTSVAADETGRLQPFVPSGYLQAGARRTIAGTCSWVNAVYELPIGRDGRFLNDSPSDRRRVPRRMAAERHQQLRLGRAAQHQRAGRHARQRLGHAGQSDRAIRDVSIPSAAQWFNTAAFAAPAAVRSIGDSPIGIVEGPAAHILDLGLMKSFSFGPGRYIQVRAEAYNALNKVNLGNPGTHLRDRELRAASSTRARRGRCSSA